MLYLANLPTKNEIYLFTPKRTERNGALGPGKRETLRQSELKEIFLRSLMTTP
jgi:hypothetical protein